MDNYWGLKPFVLALGCMGAAWYALEIKSVSLTSMLIFGAAMIGALIGFLDNRIASLEIRHDKLFDRLADNGLLDKRETE